MQRNFLLSLIKDKEIAMGPIKGVKVAGSQEMMPHVSHLMYVDNVLLFCMAKMIESMKLMSCVNYYYSRFGQVNIEELGCV